MADEELMQKVHQLGDLDLAALLCLINREHSIVSTDPDALNDLVAELQLVAADAFGLTSAVVDCSPRTTLDDLAAALLVPHAVDTASLPRADSPVISKIGGSSYFDSHRTSGQQQQEFPAINSPGTSPLQHAHHRHNGSTSPSTLGGQQPTPPQIANVILAKNLDRAPKAVQIQCLELLRTRRIYTHTSVHAAPKVFLLIAVLGAESGGTARLTPHLNDYFYIAHWHDAEDGFPRLEEEEEEVERDSADSYTTGEDDEGMAKSIARERSGSDDDDESFATTNTRSLASFNSVVRRRSPKRRGDAAPLFSTHDVDALAERARAVSVDIEVLRYQMNIVSFLRMHRAAGGVSPLATQHLELLVRGLAALHELDYATPAIVGLAARKVYLHRVRVVSDPRDERSVQWGSQISAVAALLEGVEPEDVIEDVLGMVAPPV
ncbi:MoxR-like ATPase [Microdochium nivale]|nr:MoxR-like ATPase [Microdochium nivale]